MWILFLVVVNMYDPQDIPGRIQLQFQTQVSCEQTLQSMTAWVKFPWFRVEGRCEKDFSHNRQPARPN